MSRRVGRAGRCLSHPKYLGIHRPVQGCLSCAAIHNEQLKWGADLSMGEGATSREGGPTIGVSDDLEGGRTDGGKRQTHREVYLEGEDA